MSHYVLYMRLSDFGQNVFLMQFRMRAEISLLIACSQTKFTW